VNKPSASSTPPPNSIGEPFQIEQRRRFHRPHGKPEKFRQAVLDKQERRHDAQNAEHRGCQAIE
jgi:hypothetical protein